jgi:hypothetical protein
MTAGRSTLSPASDNYYYDECKKASEKFTTAKNGRLFGVLAGIIGVASTMESTVL